MQYWHGGRPGLAAGDEILPPSVTGVLTLAEVLRGPGGSKWLLEGGGFGGGRESDRADRVYIADYIDMPVAIAALWTVTPWLDGDGAVYLVRPIGPKELDHGGEPYRRKGSCWMCARAVIQEVACPAVTREHAMDTYPDADMAERMLGVIHKRRQAVAIGGGAAVNGTACGAVQRAYTRTR